MVSDWETKASFIDLGLISALNDPSFYPRDLDTPLT